MATRRTNGAAASDDKRTFPFPESADSSSTAVSSTTPPKTRPRGATQQISMLSSEKHFSLVRALHMADYITVLNGFCGMMSVFSSLRYCAGQHAGLTGAAEEENLKNLWTALVFMPFGLFFDFFDGRVARWRNKSSLMGQELDSLADLISFGAAPASCAFALGMRTPLDTVCLTFFVLCGLLRLARFNVSVSTLPKDASGKSKYFEGTPIPTSLSIAGLMAFFVWTNRFGVDLPGGMFDLATLVGEGSWIERNGYGIYAEKIGLQRGSGWGDWTLVHPLVGLFVLHGCLMVSKTLHIPKP